MSIIDLPVLRYALVFLTCYICSAYIYIKVSKIKIELKLILLIISFTLITTISCTLLKCLHFNYYGIIYILLAIVSFLLFRKDTYYITIPTIILSLGIQYVVEIISIIILVTLFYVLKYYDVNLFTEFLASIIQILLTFFSMKIPRLKNGFRFLTNKKYFGFSVFIAGLLIILINFQKAYVSESILSIIAVGMVISTIGIIIWIRSAFTRHYRQKLKTKAEEYSKLKLAEKSKEIERLNEENASLSSIIHLDNHIINKLEATLENYKNDESIDNLRALTKQRNEYVNNKIISDKLLPTTGNNEVDFVISDMYIKAASRGIDFTLTVDCDINYLIHNIIEHADFEELISCCITNSIVDIENNPNTNGKILITISKPNDIYELTIMDNGISNDENIKSISEIIEKSKASIKTNEFDNNDSFTKSLTIRFDGLKNNTELS